MAELTGQSDDKGRYVYLSDGGHFDNLGLYEMLLRRCKIIVVIDAGRDGTYSYTDLGHSLQQTLIDTNIKVDFSPPLRSGDDHLPQKGAYARITYPELDSKGDHVTGKLLYIKPWLPSDAPTELQAFQKLKNSFPHGSTLDQFFTESDFESYRRLGEFLTCEVIRTANLPQANAQLSNLFS